MLTPYSKPQIVEKIVTSQAGAQFRVTFLVAMVNGRMNARVISAVPVTVASQTTEHASVAPILALAAPQAAQTAVFTYKPSFAPIVSPYTLLEFFVSQPTRAPSFN